MSGPTRTKKAVDVCNVRRRPAPLTTTQKCSTCRRLQLAGPVVAAALSDLDAVADVVSQVQQMEGSPGSGEHLNATTSGPYLECLLPGALGRCWRRRWWMRMFTGATWARSGDNSSSRDLTAVRAGYSDFSASPRLHVWCEKTSARAAATG